MEGAAPIENEVDRIDILYGLGVRQLGVTYSEACALGSGIKEEHDGGLTAFGKKCVERMNKVGMLDVYKRQAWDYQSPGSCLSTCS